MKKKRNKHALQTLVLSCIGLCIVGYFVYHTILGNHGWFAMLRLEKEAAAAQANLDSLQKERTELQRRTDLLKSKGMDPDLLDEKSRELLNYSKPDEIIVLTPTDKTKARPTAPLAP